MHETVIDSIAIAIDLCIFALIYYIPIINYRALTGIWAAVAFLIDFVIYLILMEVAIDFIGERIIRVRGGRGHA